MSTRTVTHAKAPTPASHTPVMHPAVKPPVPVPVSDMTLPAVKTQLATAVRLGYHFGPLALGTGTPTLLQPKLRLGPVNDPYEQEADRTATAVVQRLNAPGAPVQRQPETKEDDELVQPKALLQRQATPEEEDEIQTKALVQRQPTQAEDEEKLQRQAKPAEDDELVQTQSFLQRQTAPEQEDEEKLQRQAKPEEDDELVQTQSLLQRETAPEQEDEVQTKALIQRQPTQAEDEEKLQRQAKPAEDDEERQQAPAIQALRPSGGSDTVDPALEASIRGARGGGQLLAAAVRRPLEQHFGADFSQVKIHTDARADTLNRSLQARAFTTGQDLFFRQGEYNPQSTPGQQLLAHELTHVIQQGGSRPAQPIQAKQLHSGQPLIQRRIAPPPGTADQVASPATAEAEPSTLPTPEERAAAQAKVAAAQAAQLQTQNQVADDILADSAVSKAEPTTSISDTARPFDNGAGDKMEAAESAVEMANQATESLDMNTLSDLQQVKSPEPITPVDSDGAPLPSDQGGDLLAANVADRINILRQHGQYLRTGAKFSKSSAQKAKGTIAQAKQTVAQSESGIEQMAQQTTARKDVVGKAELALQVSEQKAEMVASKAPDLVAKADEGKEKTGPMSDEASDLAAKSSSNVPDDPKAGGKMNQQGQKLNKVSTDVTSLDGAINQSKSKASTLGEEAAQAKQKNAQTKGQITGAKATLEQTEAKIGELRTQNTQSKEQLDSFVNKPDEIMGQADTLDTEGQALIDASVEMETMLQEAQEQYQSGMQSVPAAEQGNGDNAAMVQRSPMTGVIQRGGYDDRGSVLDVGSMGPAFTGDFSTAEERRIAQEREVQRRRDQLSRINQLGDGHFERASAGDKMLMSLKLTGKNLFGGISNITVTDVNKFLGKIALAFVNPMMAMGGVLAGINMVLTGGINLLPSSEQWSKDPLGNLLKSAADIATGLTIILGSLSALAGVIILLMSALVLATFGFAAPIAAVVVPICTTVLATTLPWTITVGKVALVLQGLTLIKNLYDAATASTAEELQQNAEQISDDVKNIGSVALVIGGAKLGQRALPQQQAWAESLANMPTGGMGMPQPALAGVGGGRGTGGIAISGGALAAEGVIIPAGAAVGAAAVAAPMAMVAHGSGGSNGHKADESTQQRETTSAASVNWKGYTSGKERVHFDKHGAEFGARSQNEYLRMAKDFAANTEGSFMERQVGNTIFKYEEATNTLFIGNARGRYIKTFYKPNNGAAGFTEAIEKHIAVLKAQGHDIE